MRISDEDRQRAIDELRRHFRAGRLDADGFTARVEEAATAETLADLDHALRDLPQMRIPDPERHPPVLARRRRPGEAAGSVVDRLALLLSAVVLVAVAVLLVTAHWVWTAILAAGWLAGLLQGRYRRWRP